MRLHWTGASGPGPQGSGSGSWVVRGYGHLVCRVAGKGQPSKTMDVTLRDGQVGAGEPDT